MESGWGGLSSISSKWGREGVGIYQELWPYAYSREDGGLWVCTCVRVRACVRAYVCVCVCVCKHISFLIDVKIIN